MISLSVVIITFNEEKNIERCLQSVQSVADDIVVIDSFSTDRTEAICKQYNVRFISKAFEGYIQQKNWAMLQAKFPHVLSMDADEALDINLRNSIQNIKKNWTHDGYYISRLNNYCGKWIYHCGWFPDKKLRLWDSRKGAWGGENPHDKYIMHSNSRTTKLLMGNLLHYSYYSIQEHRDRTLKYAQIAAHFKFNKRQKVPLLKLYFGAMFYFVKNYFFKLGFLDGVMGFYVCSISAKEVYQKYAFLNCLWKSKTKSL